MSLLTRKSVGKQPLPPVAMICRRSARLNKDVAIATMFITPISLRQRVRYTSGELE
jgi:hypothetical protein